MTASPHADRHTLHAALQSGIALLQQNRFADAVRLAGDLVTAHPDDPRSLDFASEAHLANDEPEQALELIGRAVAASGGALALELKRVQLLVRMRRRIEARTTIARLAATAAAGDPRVLWQLGTLLASCNDPAGALRLFGRSHRVAGDVPRLLYDMATAQFFTGRFDEAERNLETLLVQAPQAGHALYLRATLRRQTAEANHVEDLRTRLTAGFGDRAEEAACRYALAKELEDLGHHDDAFIALETAAACKRSTLQYDLTGEIATFDTIRASFTGDPAPSGAAGEGTVFIVGMPRSGTTLVERLLVNGANARSAGELLDFGTLLGDAVRHRLSDMPPGTDAAAAALTIDFAALGRDYLEGAAQMVDGHTRFIDKMPVNFMYCGMIRRALPGARIIHLVRDPLDSCHAVYKTLFFNAYHFSYRQEELADYFIAYRRLMQHWHAVMPGAILDVRYEDLVTDPEAQGRRIFDWCGWRWDAAALGNATTQTAFTTASAAQVREPVHTRSIGRARRHAAALQPLLSRLQAAGLVGDLPPP